MKKALITGMNGTVAPALAHVLQKQGVECTAWDRRQIPTDDPSAGRAFIEKEQPDVFYQIATGSPDWIEQTARDCADLNIHYVFTGSVSVFDGSKSGPFSPDHPMDATDDYGRYKAECETRVRAVNPDACIARLGWQIGDTAGSNNMLDFITREMDEHSFIEASSAWRPSCAHLGDTAAALTELGQQKTSGLVQLEGNPGWTFHRIVTALNQKHGMEWDIRESSSPDVDIRMVNTWPTMGQLDTRLES